MMRDLNPEELKEYLDFCRTSEHELPENWQETASSVEIQDIISANNFVDLEKAIAEDLEQHTMKDALVAMWLTAFQCGREFETRHQEKEQLEEMVK